MTCDQTKILVIEDDLALAKGLQAAIQEGGFGCDVAGDGSTGLELATSGEYDLVVLDILLPTQNGFQVCVRLRETNSSIPILVLTAKSGEWDQAEILGSGADDCLTKPVSIVVFMAHLRALLRRSQLFRDPELTVDGITLDALRRVCTFGGDSLQLSGREVEVLAQLMLARGAVVEKQQLVKNVWGEHFRGEPKIVEVYIRHLRTKLEPAFQRKVIATAHGVGYRLAVSDVT
jgi:DNA-binding response OmpR family regulator